jgi:tRNA U34 5-carboxymethylaminomethyl modifying enzyme MnmG/GidA
VTAEKLADDLAKSHVPHPRMASRKAEGVASAAPSQGGFNGWLAVKITDGVGTMWCAYAFTALALISLPTAIAAGTGPLISWIAQTFLQLVLLSIIMVGQKVAAAASDKQAYQTYRDAEALLEMSDELHKLVKLNNKMTDDIRAAIAKDGAFDKGAGKKRN